jgi:hypothetical protein
MTGQRMGGRIIACAQLFRHPELIKKKLPVFFFIGTGMIS